MSMSTMRRRAARLSCTLAASLWTAGAAQAQDSVVDVPGLPGIDAPVLAPTHMRQAVRDIPASVTILQAETLATYGFLGIGEAVRMVAGSTPKRLSGANYDLPLGRKSAVGQPRVTLLVDGIEVGGTVLSEDDDWSDLPVSIDDVERIEVTCGPGAAGFGRASKVVVINIVTKHPADVERGHGRLVFGTYDTRRALVRGGWTIGPAALRLTLHHRDRNEIEAWRAGGAHSDPMGVDRLTVRTAILFGEGSELTVDAAYLSGHHDGDLAATPALGRQEVRNGYASAKWTQSLSLANELSLRLDQWGNTDQSFGADCTTEACDPDVNVERRTRLELQDVHVFADGLRVVAGVGLRQSLIRDRNDEVLRWSARYRRGFAGVDWRPVPTLALSAGWSADGANRDNHDRTWRAGANWHVDDDQTLRLAWSSGDWASDQGPRMGLAGNLLTEERMQSTELGYLLDDPASRMSVNARIFWSRLTGQVLNSKTGEQPAHGEFYGAELRVASEVSARCSGFVSLTTNTEGSSSSLKEGHRPRPWGGAAGLALSLDEGWRLSMAYYASSKAASSTQTAGRADITLLKDFRLGDARWRAGLNLRQTDHLRRDAADGSGTLTENATARSYFASLAASF